MQRLNICKINFFLILLCTILVNTIQSKKDDAVAVEISQENFDRIFSILLDKSSLDNSLDILKSDFHLRSDIEKLNHLWLGNSFDGKLMLVKGAINNSTIISDTLKNHFRSIIKCSTFELTSGGFAKVFLDTVPVFFDFIKQLPEKKFIKAVAFIGHTDPYPTENKLILFRHFEGIMVKVFEDQIDPTTQEESQVDNAKPSRCFVNRSLFQELATKENSLDISYESFSQDTSIIKRTSPWLFDDSDKRYLTDNDVKSLSKEELWIARNEIFARNGYIFNSPKGNAYVETLGSTYRGIVSDANKIILNEFEKANIDLIKKYENK